MKDEIEVPPDRRLSLSSFSSLWTPAPVVPYAPALKSVRGGRCMDAWLMDALLIATGFTGALTLIYLGRQVLAFFCPPPTVSAHFAPGGNCAEVLVSEIGRARREVLFVARTLGLRPISQALADARTRGLIVEVVLDPDAEDDSAGEVAFLKEHGVATIFDTEHAQTNNTVIIDRKNVLTGSFDLTHQGETAQAGNFLVLRHHSALAQSFHLDYSTHKAHSSAPGAVSIPQQVSSPQPAPQPVVLPPAPAQPAPAPAPVVMVPAPVVQQPAPPPAPQASAPPPPAPLPAAPPPAPLPSAPMPAAPRPTEIPPGLETVASYRFDTADDLPPKSPPKPASTSSLLDTLAQWQATSSREGPVSREPADEDNDSDTEQHKDESPSPWPVAPLPRDHESDTEQDEDDLSDLPAVPVVTLAAAELIARLRQQAALPDSDEQEDSPRGAA